MKNLFGITTAAIAATVLASSCDKISESGRNEVKFTIETTETRALIETTESMNTVGKTFGVFLFNHSGNTLIGSGKAECQDPEDNWQIKPIVYWEGRTMDCWSYYPASLDATVAGNTSMSFSRDVTDTDDVLCAFSGSNTSKTNDGAIPVHFYHALSCIEFKFAAASDGEKLLTGDDIKITDITISNIKKSGTCTYAPADSFDGLFSWSTGTTLGDVKTVYSSANAVVPGTTLGEGTTAKQQLLIPQTLSQTAGIETAVTINWTKNGVAQDARKVYINKYTGTNTSSTMTEGTPVTWTAGYKYVYSIKVKDNGAAMEVSLEVLPWEVEASSIEYGETVTSSGSLNMSAEVFQNTSHAISGEFKIDTPVDGTWIVSLSNAADFDVFTLDGSTRVSSNPATGSIDGSTAKFYVQPKEGVNRSIERSTKIFVSVRRLDGTIISADEQLSTAGITLTLPKQVL